MLYFREEEDCCFSRRKLLPSHQSKMVLVRKAPLSSVTLPHTDTFVEVWKGSGWFKSNEKAIALGYLEVQWRCLDTFSTQGETE